MKLFVTRIRKELMKWYSSVFDMHFNQLLSGDTCVVVDEISQYEAQTIRT